MPQAAGAPQRHGGAAPASLDDIRKILAGPRKPRLRGDTGMRSAPTLGMAAIGITIAAFAASSRPVSADTLDNVRKAGVIRVGNGAMGVKPFLWQHPDRTHQGLENDMLKYTLEKIGVPRYEYVVTE